MEWERLFIYRGYEIRYVRSPPGAPREMLGWEWTHKDYDGPEDRRHGRADSMREAFEAVDEMMEEGT